MKSETSMRELSNRNLMDETLNKSLFLQSKLKKEEEEKIPLGSSEIPLPKTNISLILVPLLLWFLIVSVLVTNLVKNSILSNIKEKDSATNVFTFFQQSKIYSYYSW